MQQNIKKNPSQPPLIRGGENADDSGLKFIPYNKELVSLAREFRSNQTPAEKIFWYTVIKNKKMTGYKFTKQKPLDNFIVDFYCAELLLAVEIDGDIHKSLKIRDKERADILKNKYGLKIIRYKNEDVLNNIEKIIKNLEEVICSRKLDLVPLIRGI